MNCCSSCNWRQCSGRRIISGGVGLGCGRGSGGSGGSGGPAGGGIGGGNIARILRVNMLDYYYKNQVFKYHLYYNIFYLNGLLFVKLLD